MPDSDLNNPEKTNTFSDNGTSALIDHLSIREIWDLCSKIAKMAQKELEERDGEETSGELVKLMLFNFLAKNSNPDEKEWQNMRTEINHYIQAEKEAANYENSLPTIGIEIEVPIRDSRFLKQIIAVFDGLCFYQYHPENDQNEKPELYELATHFSYSALTQAKILQELAKLGFVPLEPIPKNQNSNSAFNFRIPKDNILSLHINIGMPEKIVDSGDFSNTNFQIDLSLINQAIALAFTSPERLTNRKTAHSLAVKSDASPSKKTEDSSLKMIAKNFSRVELRAGEFRNQSTYEMLLKTQRLMAILFSRQKIAQRQKATPTEKKLASLSEILIGEVISTMAKYGYHLYDIDDATKTGIEKTIGLIRETNFAKDLKTIINKYSRKTGIILKLN